MRMCFIFGMCAKKDLNLRIFSWEYVKLQVDGVCVSLSHDFWHTKHSVVLWCVSNCFKWNLNHRFFSPLTLSACMNSQYNICYISALDALAHAHLHTPIHNHFASHRSRQTALFLNRDLTWNAIHIAFFGIKMVN